MQAEVFAAFLEGIDQRAGARSLGVDGAPDRERAHGRRLFERFAGLHPAHLALARNAFDYLAGLGRLHATGRSSLITVEHPDRDILILEYRSDKPSPAICLGLIEGCLAHYGCRGHVTVLRVVGSDTPRYRFEIRGRPFRDRKPNPFQL